MRFDQAKLNNVTDRYDFTMKLDVSVAVFLLRKMYPSLRHNWNAAYSKHRVSLTKKIKSCGPVSAWSQRTVWPFYILALLKAGGILPSSDVFLWTSRVLRLSVVFQYCCASFRLWSGWVNVKIDTILGIITVYWEWKWGFFPKWVEAFQLCRNTMKLFC